MTGPVCAHTGTTAAMTEKPQIKATSETAGLRAMDYPMTPPAF
jgi:hypothetical protein